MTTERDSTMPIDSIPDDKFAEVRELFTRINAKAGEVYSVNERGICFVEGLGWVVRCSDAMEYVAALIAAHDKTKA